MTEIPVEKRFAVLCQITRAQHFAWRQAVVELCPEVDPSAVVDRMWEITGVDTAAAYIRRLDPDAPLAAQVAAGIAWSSASMGEDAVVEPGEAGKDEVYLRHVACPWAEWHGKHDLLAEDRPGCDAWFRSTLAQVGAAAKKELRFETLQSLPEGADSCLRRIWVEERS